MNRPKTMKDFANSECLWLEPWASINLSEKLVSVYESYLEYQ